MDLIHLVRRDYQEAVALADAPTELKRSLAAHERVPGFIDNLARELSRVPGLKRETIKVAVYELTNLFIANVKRRADEMHMSEVEKHRRVAEYERAKEAEAMIDKLSGGTEHVERNERGETHRASVEV